MRPALIITSLGLVWFGLALVAMLPGSIQTAAVPIGTMIPSGVAIIGRQSGFLILRSNDPKYVRELYAGGAWVVLPARQKSCLDLQLRPLA